MLIAKTTILGITFPAKALLNGSIVTHNNDNVELKKVFDLEVPTGQSKVVQTVSGWECELIGEFCLEIEECKCDEGEILPILNLETIEVTETKTFGVVNVYPGKIDIIELPSIKDLIGIPWLMSSSTLDEISGNTFPDNFSLISMPEGTSLKEASIFGLRSGTEYSASITEINDLSTLPTSFLNTEVTWDLSKFSETTGNFYLAQVEMPLEEFCSVPEPSFIFGILNIGIFGLFSKFKRKFF
ncbi:hypothetical protein [Okeania sp. KiyG1]|uniref:hypothetical protein n=1 Tax=Okeania sp. KiyG1 TaxID=2720165 RepID=UPI0019207770|nr:hypothetical protein [Okeania sp. KiyG1]GGA01956.1 hypothetical protein CYANOKiyG1_13870 [Okeania sp. KiyG1]